MIAERCFLVPSFGSPERPRLRLTFSSIWRRSFLSLGFRLFAHSPVRGEGEARRSSLGVEAL